MQTAMNNFVIINGKTQIKWSEEDGVTCNQTDLYAIYDVTYVFKS